ncbi:hypothetical protein V8G54_018383 [Vigna mungo]|uniref:Uncharacterized protein n=1 Tax=Vigna mungo TaxID=3915 RepID=A0AAQ3N8N5_VIGMU
MHKTIQNDSECLIFSKCLSSIFGGDGEQLFSHEISRFLFMQASLKTEREKERDAMDATQVLNIQCFHSVQFLSYAVTVLPHLKLCFISFTSFECLNRDQILIQLNQ